MSSRIAFCASALLWLCGCPGEAPAPSVAEVAPLASSLPAPPPFPQVAQVRSEVPPQPLAYLAPAVRPIPEAPTGVLGARPEELRLWVQSERVAPEVRYTALRELEASDPQAAVELAATLAGSSEGVLRTNAIALLARSDDPRAAEALAELGPRERRLAERLAARRR